MPSLCGAAAVQSWRTYLAARTLQEGTRHRQLANCYSSLENALTGRKVECKWAVAGFQPQLTNELVTGPAISNPYGSLSLDLKKPVVRPCSLSLFERSSRPLGVLLNSGVSLKDSVRILSVRGSREYTTAMPTDAQVLV